MVSYNINGKYALISTGWYDDFGNRIMGSKKLIGKGGVQS